MSLFEKMFNVMNESEAIEKNMTVGKGQNAYKAVSEADVLNMVKPLFKKNKLIIFPVAADLKEIVDVYNKTDFDGKVSESQRAITQVKTTFRIVDVETGEFQDVVGVGNGADSQDKGAGKCFTYSYKNAFQKSFMLFSGEDTDNEHSDDIGQPKKPYEPKKPEAKVNLYVPPTQPKQAEVKQTPAPATQTPSAGKFTPAEVKPEEEKPTGYICENCTKPVTDVKAKDGKIYTAHAIAMKAQREYGCILCFDCAVKAKKSADEVAKEIAKIEAVAAANRIVEMTKTK